MVMRNGRIEQEDDDSKIDYEMLSPSHQFTATSNQIPMSSTIKGARLFIASKYGTQAVALTNPEAPLVEPLDDDTGLGYSHSLGKKLGQRFSPVPGVVKRVHEDFIDIIGDDGKPARVELRRFFPRNKKSYLNEMPMVAVGDRVTPDMPVARNNYTDKAGRLALGKNLAVAFMPAPDGATFEDAISVSQSAANKMTSPHMYGFDVEHKNGVESNKQKFVSLFPNKYTNAQLAKFDSSGMLKTGAVVDEGDPVLLSFAPRSLSSKDAALGNLSKVLRNSYQDLSQTWDKSTPGLVAHAVAHRGGHTLKITTNAPLQEGDKLSGLQGAKGVVSRIIPDEQMIHDKDGNPMDILINPAALIGRVNPGMVYEALLGKIAYKHNKTYALPSFSEDSFRDYVKHELAAHGESDREDLVNPVTGRIAPQVLTGRQLFLKLEHTSNSKISGRGDGSVDANDQPSKGGDEGAKRVGGLQMNALLSHGVPEVIKDAHLYRGSSNPDMWRKVRTGEALPLPKSPFIYDKFINSLRGAGVNVKDIGGGRTRLLAMTDKDVDELAPHELRNAETISYKDATPVSGGLMDFSIHGGPEGRGWSHIKLDEPLPNPMMEDPVRRLLGLTEKQMRGIIGGTETLSGKRGPVAIRDALAAINLDEMAKVDRDIIRNGKKTRRDDAVRRLNFVTGLQHSGLQPVDLVINKVPVLPPTFRPITKVGKLMLTADANYLYRDLMAARNSLRGNKGVLPDEDLADERLALYDSIKAVQGLGDPINPETAAKGVKGFVRQIAGVGGPKTGLFVSKVIGHPVNAVGRSVIVPDSDLNMDEVGIPKEMAWRMFEAQTMRSMVKGGMPATEADKHIEKHDAVAMQHLLNTVDNSHVMYGRDPALHRFSIMGGKPRLVAGNNIRLSPLVVKPFGADFDGDTYVGLIQLLIKLDSDKWLTHDERMITQKTKIATSGQPLMIQDIPVVPGSKKVLSGGIDEFDVCPGVDVYALDPDTGAQGFYPVTKFTVHHNVAFKKVSIKRGRQVEELIVTDDHSLIAFKHGRIQKVRPQDAVGMMIPSSVKLDATTTIQKSVRFEGHNLRLGKECGDYSKDIVLDRDFGLFVGMLMGDGWIGVNDVFHLAFSESSMEEAFDRCVSSDNLPFKNKSASMLAYESPGSLVKGGTETRIKMRASAYCSPFGRWIRDGIGSGALNKMVPYFAFSAPDEFIHGLIDGMISTDGTISVCKSVQKSTKQLTISIATSSINMVEGLRFLFLRLGVGTSSTSYKSPTSGRDAFLINISSVDFVRFVHESGFFITNIRKNEILQGNLDLVNLTSPISKSGRTVPYPREMHQFFLDTISAHKGDVRTKNWLVYFSEAKSVGFIGREILSDLAGRLGDDIPLFVKSYLKLALDCSIAWSMIESVEDYCTGEGYDLTVPGPYTFATASGVFVQDSMNIHLPVSDEAQREVREIMLPSQNLFGLRHRQVQYLPSQEFIYGLSAATGGSNKAQKEKPIQFKTRAEALAAYQNKLISIDQPVEVME